MFIDLQGTNMPVHGSVLRSTGQPSPRPEERAGGETSNGKGGMAQPTWRREIVAILRT